MTVLLLPLDVIHVDPRLNVSRGGNAITETNVRSLADDIAAYGQQDPVGVVAVADAKWIETQGPQVRPAVPPHAEYVLVYGFRRFQAIRSLSRDDRFKSQRRFHEIKAIELGPLTLSQAELANVAENWSREPPTEFDLTVACDRFVRFHKVKENEIATRINRSVSFVSACVAIVSKVAPDLLDHYKVNCSKEIRRRMLVLAEVDAPTLRERHELQRQRWEEMEADAARDRRNDPQGGIRPRHVKRSGALVSRADLKEAAERLLVAREVYDGQQWQPIDPATRNVLREWLRWSLDASMELPLR